MLKDIQTHEKIALQVEYGKNHKECEFTGCNFSSIQGRASCILSCQEFLSRPKFQLSLFRWQVVISLFTFILFLSKYIALRMHSLSGKRVQSLTHHCGLRDENYKACLSYSIEYCLCHYVTSHHMVLAV